MMILSGEHWGMLCDRIKLVNKSDYIANKIELVFDQLILFQFL